MDLLRTGNNKRRNIKQHRKHSAAVSSIKHANGTWGNVYDDGVYQIDKINFHGKALYNINKHHKGVLYNRESVRESMHEINRLKRRDSAGIRLLDTRDKTSNAWKLGANTQELLKSHEEVYGYDLDFEVRGLVKDLNNAGFKTAGSCAGHKDGHGFVTFESPYFDNNQRREINRIASKYNLKRVVISNSDYIDKPNSDESPALYAKMDFSPIGIGSG